MLIRVRWRHGVSNAHRQRGFTASETPVAARNNNQNAIQASSQLSGLYLTKVIILSHFLCVGSWRNGGGARHSTLTRRMICVASSHRRD